jgi:hypothetical protein
MANLTPEQELNVHSGETWIRGAERMYGGKLPGMGAVIEYGPREHNGVDTLMKVGNLGWMGEDTWGFLFSPIVRRGTALGMFFHGYKRTGSLGWAAAYAAFGFAVPPAAGAVAAVQMLKK